MGRYDRGLQELHGLAVGRRPLEQNPTETQAQASLATRRPALTFQPAASSALRLETTTRYGSSFVPATKESPSQEQNPTGFVVFAVLKAVCQRDLSTKFRVRLWHVDPYPARC